MSRLVRCTCRSHCLAFSTESQSYEGEGALVSKSTAANHRRDDLRLQTLDTFTENVATCVLNSTLPAEPHDELHGQYPHHPGSNVQESRPLRFHVQAHSDDLYFMLEEETAHRCTWAPINHSLVFAVSPSPTLQYRRPQTSDAFTLNRELYPLDPEERSNTAYLENEGRLYEIVRVLQRQSASDTRNRLLARAYEALAMMERHKEMEWNRQRDGSIARRHGYRVVDTGAYIALASLSNSQRTQNQVPISTTRSPQILSSLRPS